MENAEIVARLLRGSRNIDLMRERIHMTISIVMGYVHSYCCYRQQGSTTCFTFRCESDGCSWRVTADVRVNSQNVECWSKENFGESLIFSSTNQVRLKSPDVLRVYRSLQVLLDGLVKEFPKLESDWKYLLDASEVELTS